MKCIGNRKKNPLKKTPINKKNGREKIHFERSEREKLIQPTAEDMEGVVEISLRPSKIDEFVGQERVNDNLKITLQAAQKRKESL